MALLTHQQCLAAYGPPEKEASLILWDVPTYLEVGVIPKRIYCNKDLIRPLKLAFEALIKTGCVKELKTWDGCFNIRPKKTGRSPSLHSWGVAVDVNAAWNGYGKKPVLSTTFVHCFTDNGFDWGGLWTTPDGMHFQLKPSLVTPIQ